MPKMRAGDVRMEIAVEETLYQRLKSMCTRMHIPIKYLVLDALTERVEYLEERRHAEKERRMAERATAGSRTEFTAFRRLRGSTLAPVPRPKPLGVAVGGAGDVPPVPPVEYTKHAEKIYAALRGGSPLEARLRTMDAVAAIKKRHPLTHPPEQEITSMLERLVLEMREAASTVDQEPEVVIDVSRVRTFGNLGVGQEE